MKLVVYSSQTRDFDGRIFVVRTINIVVVLFAKEHMWFLLTVNFRQPSHEFTFSVDMILYLIYWY
jgi:hypothetical protein